MGLHTIDRTVRTDWLSENSGRFCIQIALVMLPYI